MAELDISGNSNQLDCSVDSGICVEGVTKDIKKKILEFKRILFILERDKEAMRLLRERLSRIAERKIVKKKKDDQSVCNVCFTQIDIDDSKTCVACYSCAKNVCRGEKCSEWVPEDGEWRCQLCAATRDSYGKTSTWVQEQYAVKRASLTECSYPMRARSEIYIPLCDPNESAFLCNFESVSEVASPINPNQKQHIREYIEEVLAEMIGGSLENATVEQISTNKDYQQVRNGHELQGVSNVRLRRLIENIIAETIRQPPFATAGLITTANAADSSDVGHAEDSPLNGNQCNGNGGQYFESKKYHDLLATAVLNKIVNTHGNGRHSESSPDLTSSSVLDSNHNAINLNKTDESVSSSSSVEPRSESSLTEPIRSINKNNEDDNYGSFYHDDVANDNIEADRESVLSDFISSHMVPLPHISADPESDEDEDEEDFISVASSRDANWEDNWLFKKKKSNKTSSSVGMLVPAPKEDIRALIGDKPTDEVSDLSEVGSDTDDSSLEMVSASLDPLNDRLVNKHLIGGKNTKIVLDELVDRSSMISTSSIPENEPPYTETKNEFVVSNDGLNESQPLKISVNNCSKAISTEAINSNVTKAVSAKVEKLEKESQVAEDESIVPPPNDFTDDEKMRNLLAKFNEEQNSKTDSGDDNSSSMSPRSSISCALSAGIERAELDAYEGITDFCVEGEEGPASEIDSDMPESSSRRPSVIEILAAIALGPMLAVSASDDRNILTELELSSLMELNELAMAQMNAKANEERRLGVITEESFEIGPGEEREERRIESIECTEEADLLSSPKMVMDAIRDLVGREVMKSVRNEECSFRIEEVTEESAELESNQLLSNDPADSTKKSDEQKKQEQLEIEETFEIISDEKELSEDIVQIESTPQIETEEMQQEQSGTKQIAPHELEQIHINEIKPNDDDNGITINSLSEELGFEKVITDDTSSISDESLHTIGSSTENSEDLDGDTTSFFTDEQKIFVIAEMSTDQKLQEKMTENQSSESDKTMNEFILPPPTAFCDKESSKLNENGSGSKQVQEIEAHINSGTVQDETQITSQNSNNVPEQTVTEKETHNEKLCNKTVEETNTESVQMSEIVEISSSETVKSDEPPDKLSIGDTTLLVSLTETPQKESIQESEIVAENKEVAEENSQDKADIKIEEAEEIFEKIAEDQTAFTVRNEPAALKTLSEAQLSLKKSTSEELLNDAPSCSLGNLQQVTENEASNTDLQVTEEIKNSSQLEDLPNNKPSEEKNLNNQVDELSEVNQILEIQPIEEPTTEQGSNILIKEITHTNSESLENNPAESGELNHRETSEQENPVESTNGKAFEYTTTENIEALVVETQKTVLEDNLKAEGLSSKNKSSEPQENVKTEESDSKTIEEQIGNQESNQPEDKLLSVVTDILNTSEEAEKKAKSNNENENDKKSVDISQANELIAETTKEQNKNNSDESSNNFEKSPIAEKSSEELSKISSEEVKNNTEDQSAEQIIKPDQIPPTETISQECSKEQEVVVEEIANTIDTDIRLPKTIGAEKLVLSKQSHENLENERKSITATSFSTESLDLVEPQTADIATVEPFFGTRKVDETEKNQAFVSDAKTLSNAENTDILDNTLTEKTLSVATNLEENLNSDKQSVVEIIKASVESTNTEHSKINAQQNCEGHTATDPNNISESETTTAKGSLDPSLEENPTESQTLLRNEDDIVPVTENTGEHKPSDDVKCITDELSEEHVTEDIGNTETVAKETSEASSETESLQAKSFDDEPKICPITLTDSLCIEESNSNSVEQKCEETHSQTQEKLILLENITDEKLDILTETEDEIKTECSNQQDNNNSNNIEAISSNQSEETQNKTTTEPQNEPLVEENAKISNSEGQQPQIDEILYSKTEDDAKSKLTEDESMIESLTGSEEICNDQIKAAASAEETTVSDLDLKTCLEDGENPKADADDKQEEHLDELSQTSKVDEEQTNDPEAEDLGSQSKSESVSASGKISTISISDAKSKSTEKVQDDTKENPEELTDNVVEETERFESQEPPSSENLIESVDAEKSEKDGKPVAGDELLDVNANTLEDLSLKNDQKLTKSSFVESSLVSQDIEAVADTKCTEEQFLASTTNEETYTIVSNEINTEKIQTVEATDNSNVEALSSQTHLREEPSIESSDLKSDTSTEKTVLLEDNATHLDTEESIVVSKSDTEEKVEIPANDSEVEVPKENTLSEEVSGFPTIDDVTNQTNADIQKADLDLNEQSADLKNIQINCETTEEFTKSENVLQSKIEISINKDKTNDKDISDPKTIEEKCETPVTKLSQNEKPETEDEISKSFDQILVSEESCPTINTLEEQESQLTTEEKIENITIEPKLDNTTSKAEEQIPTEYIIKKKNSLTVRQNAVEEEHEHNPNESDEEYKTSNIDDYDIQDKSSPELLSATDITKEQTNLTVNQIEPEPKLLAKIVHTESDEKLESKETVCAEEILGNEVVTIEDNEVIKESNCKEPESDPIPEEKVAEVGVVENIIPKLKTECDTDNTNDEPIPIAEVQPNNESELERQEIVSDDLTLRTDDEKIKSILSENELTLKTDDEKIEDILVIKSSIATEVTVEPETLKEQLSSNPESHHESTAEFVSSDNVIVDKAKSATVSLSTFQNGNISNTEATSSNKTVPQEPTKSVEGVRNEVSPDPETTILNEPKSQVPKENVKDNEVQNDVISKTETVISYETVSPQVTSENVEDKEGQNETSSNAYHEVKIENDSQETTENVENKEIQKEVSPDAETAISTETESQVPKENVEDNKVESQTNSDADHKVKIENDSNDVEDISIQNEVISKTETMISNEIVSPKVLTENVGDTIIQNETSSDADHKETSGTESQEPKRNVETPQIPSETVEDKGVQNEVSPDAETTISSETESQVPKKNVGDREVLNETSSDADHKETSETESQEPKENVETPQVPSETDEDKGIQNELSPDSESQVPTENVEDKEVLNKTISDADHKETSVTESQEPKGNVETTQIPSETDEDKEVQNEVSPDAETTISSETESQVPKENVKDKEVLNETSSDADHKETRETESQEPKENVETPQIPSDTDEDKRVQNEVSPDAGTTISSETESQVPKENVEDKEVLNETSSDADHKETSETESQEPKENVETPQVPSETDEDKGIQNELSPDSESQVPTENVEDKEVLNKTISDADHKETSVTESQEPKGNVETTQIPSETDEDKEVQNEVSPDAETTISSETESQVPKENVKDKEVLNETSSDADHKETRETESQEPKENVETPQIPSDTDEDKRVQNEVSPDAGTTISSETESQVPKENVEDKEVLNETSSDADHKETSETESQEPKENVETPQVPSETDEDKGIQNELSPDSESQVPTENVEDKEVLNKTISDADHKETSVTASQEPKGNVETTQIPSETVEDKEVQNEVSPDAETTISSETESQVPKENVKDKEVLNETSSDADHKETRETESQEPKENVETPQIPSETVEDKGVQNEVSPDAETTTSSVTESQVPKENVGDKEVPNKTSFDADHTETSETESQELKENVETPQIPSETDEDKGIQNELSPDSECQVPKENVEDKEVLNKTISDADHKETSVTESQEPKGNVETPQIPSETVEDKEVQNEVSPDAETTTSTVTEIQVPKENVGDKEVPNETSSDADHTETSETESQELKENVETPQIPSETVEDKGVQNEVSPDAETTISSETESQVPKENVEDKEFLNETSSDANHKETSETGSQEPKENVETPQIPSETVEDKEVQNEVTPDAETTTSSETESQVSKENVEDMKVLNETSSDADHKETSETESQEPKGNVETPQIPSETVEDKKVQNEVSPDAETTISSETESQVPKKNVGGKEVLNETSSDADHKETSETESQEPKENVETPQIHSETVEDKEVQNEVSPDAETTISSETESQVPKENVEDKEVLNETTSDADHKETSEIESQEPKENVETPQIPSETVEDKGVQNEVSPDAETTTSSETESQVPKENVGDKKVLNETSSDVDHKETGEIESQETKENVEIPQIPSETVEDKEVQNEVSPDAETTISSETESQVPKENIEDKEVLNETSSDADHNETSETESQEPKENVETPQIPSENVVDKEVQNEVSPDAETTISSETESQVPKENIEEKEVLNETSSDADHKETSETESQEPKENVETPQIPSENVVDKEVQNEVSPDAETTTSSETESQVPKENVEGKEVQNESSADADHKVTIENDSQESTENAEDKAVRNKVISEAETSISNETVLREEPTKNVEDIELKTEISPDAATITENQISKDDVEDKEVQNEVVSVTETIISNETQVPTENVESIELQNEISSATETMPSIETKNNEVSLIPQGVSSDTETLIPNATESQIPTDNIEYIADKTEVSDQQQVSSQIETIIPNENESQKPTENIKQPVVQEKSSENEKVPMDKESQVEKNNEPSITNSDQRILVLTPEISKDILDSKIVSASTEDRLKEKTVVEEKEAKSEESQEACAQNVSEKQAESKELSSDSQNKTVLGSCSEITLQAENIITEEVVNINQAIETEEPHIQKSPNDSEKLLSDPKISTPVELVNSNDKPTEAGNSIGNSSVINTEKVKDDLVEQESDKKEENSKADNSITETILIEKEKDNSILETAVTDEEITNGSKSLEVGNATITPDREMLTNETVEESKTEEIETLIKDVETSDSKDIIFIETETSSAKEDKIIEVSNLQGSDTKNCEKPETENLSISSEKLIDQSEKPLSGNIQEESKPIEKIVVESLDIKAEKIQVELKEVINESVQTKETVTESTVNELPKTNKLLESVPILSEEIQTQISSNLEDSNIVTAATTDTIKSDELTTLIKTNEEVKDETPITEDLTSVSEMSDSLKSTIEEEIKKLNSMPETELEASKVFAKEEPCEVNAIPNEIVSQTSEITQPKETVVEEITLTIVKQNESSEDLKLSESATNSKDQDEKDVPISEGLLKTSDGTTNKACAVSGSDESDLIEPKSIARTSYIKETKSKETLESACEIEPTQVKIGEIQNQETSDTEATPHNIITDETQNQISKQSDIIKVESNSEIDSKDATKPVEEDSKTKVREVIEVGTAEEKEVNIEKVESKPVEDSPTQKKRLETKDSAILSESEQTNAEENENIKVEEEKKEENVSKEEISSGHIQIPEKGGDNIQSNSELVQNLATDLNITQDSIISSNNESISSQTSLDKTTESSEAVILKTTITEAVRNEKLTEETIAVSISNEPISTEEVRNKASQDKITESSEAVILETAITKAVKDEKLTEEIIAVSTLPEPISDLKEIYEDKEEVKSTQSIAEPSKSAETRKEIDAVAVLDIHAKVNSQTENSQEKINKVSGEQIQITNIDGAQISAEVIPATEIPEPIKLDTVNEEIQKPSKCSKEHAPRLNSPIAEDKLSEDMTEQVTEVEEIPPIEVLKATCKIITHPPLQPTESLIESAQCLYDEILHPIVETSREINTPTLAEELRMAADKNDNKELPIAERVIPQSIACESRCFTPQPQLNESMASDSVASTEQSNAQDAAQGKHISQVAKQLLFAEQSARKPKAKISGSKFRNLTLRDRRFLAELERRRKQRELIQNYLDSLDCTDTQSYLNEDLYLFESKCSIERSPYSLFIEPSDYCIVGATSPSPIANTHFLNTNILFSDRISSESNCTDDSTTTVIDTFGSMESRSNSDSGEEFSPDDSTDRDSSATATTANNNILTTTNKATNQSHIYSQPPQPQPELRTESACSKLLETRTTTGGNEEHVDDDPLKHLVPGSIAEREYKKWYNAVDMPNNPYSVEALRRRLSGGLDRAFDLPNISPCNEDNPLNLSEGSAQEAEAESKAQDRDYSRYSRDYYINDAKQASGTTKKSPTSPSPQISSPTSTASSIELDERVKHNSNIVETTPPVKEMCHKLEKQCRIEADIYLATPVQVIEDIPQAFADKNAIQTIGTINSLTTEAVSKLSSETSSNLTNESLTPSEDSDTIRIYDLKKQETRLIKESTQTTTITVPKSPEKKVRPTELDIVPTLAPPIATVSSKSSIPTSFKFLQPKRKLINPSQVLSIDLDATPVTPATPDKPVIEAEVVHALPSVKALAKAFLLTSSTSSSDNKWRKARAKAPLQFFKPTTPTPTPTPTTAAAANISRGIQKQPEPVIPDTTSQGSEDATIASDLSSLETDPPSRLDGDMLDSNVDEDRALSPVVLPGCLRNNIAFFENLKNK